MKTFRDNLLHHYLYNTKLAKKFLYAIVFLLCLTMLMLNSYIKNNTEKIIIDEVKTTSRQFLEQYIDNINYRISKFNTLLNSISSNQSIRTLMDQESYCQEDYDKIEKEIRQILNYQFPSALYAINLYPLDHPLDYSSTFIKPLSKIDNALLKQIKTGTYDKYFLHNEGFYEVNLLSVLKPIYSMDGKKTTCIIKLSLFPDRVFRPVATVDNRDNHKVLIVNKDTELAYGNTFRDTHLYLDYLHNSYTYLYDGYSIADYSTKDGVYMTSLSSSFGYRAVYYFSYEDTFASVNTLNRVITTYTVLLLVIICSSATFLSYSINKRMGLVLHKIKQVSTGNLNLEPSHIGKDEIGIFDQALTKMADQLKVLINKNYISEMKKKDAEFMALQAQINPHFLFNSLEIINALVEVGQYDTACLVNAKLSELLRYSINHNSSGIVTFKEEIEHVENYIYIQKIRFRDKFSFNIDIDESCLKYSVIKLIFQPFIENCINHGFAGRQKSGIINFIVQEKINHIQVTVMDNGKGMTQDEYYKLLEKLENQSAHNFKEKNQSIGLFNIHYRLKLKYGSDYSIHIDTAPNHGMCITLNIPKIPLET